MPPSTPALCGLCNTNESKYKCPTCLVPYCSLACYKPHKLHHTESPTVPPPIVASKPLEKVVEKKEHKFARLRDDPRLVAMLRSKTLRTHLEEVYKVSKRVPQGVKADQMALGKLRRLRTVNQEVDGFVRMAVDAVEGKVDL